jgi:hypothetical protein
MRGTAAPLVVSAQPMRNAEKGVRQRRNDATPRGVLGKGGISMGSRQSLCGGRTGFHNASQRLPLQLFLQAGGTVAQTARA